jgi:hypothetical protein
MFPRFLYVPAGVARQTPWVRNGIEVKCVPEYVPAVPVFFIPNTIKGWGYVLLPRVDDIH